MSQDYHLAKYQDLRNLTLQVEVFTAIDLRIFPLNNYLLMHTDYVDTTFEALQATPQARALWTRLRTLGVPQPLREIILCEWMLEFVSIVYY